MPVTYLPYFPETVEGQALLGTLTRTRRVLRYQGSDTAANALRRGLPLYETALVETVAPPPADSNAANLLLRGECLSACAYLKNENIAVDLVYIDPPFASGADYAKSVYLRRHPHKAEALAEAEAELELDELRAFEEKMYGDIWNKEDYLNWMFENLTAIKAVMSDTASIYVHIGVNISHYVKILLDEVFGEENFRNEIVVKRIKKNIRENEYTRSLNSATDTIFFYTRNEDVLMLPPARPAPKEDRWHAFDAPELRTGMDYDLFGRRPPPGRHWMRSEAIAREWIKEGKLRPHENTGKPEYKVDASEMMVCDSLWDDISAYSFSNDYATEKSEPLLRRIVRASTKDAEDNGGTPMVVADFFGGSGVTAKVAHDLNRRFIHVDVGLNSVQTARDRLCSAGAAFSVLDVQDGVSLFRNPVQTMDKLKTLIPGLKNEDALDKFWEGAIQDSKNGLVPVYLPNLLDHQTKVLDVPLINRVLSEALPDLPDGTRHAIVYYVDVFDRAAVEKFIAEHNPTQVSVELRDLKEILDEVVLNDEADFLVSEPGENNDMEYRVEIVRFESDRLRSKISDYNQKRQIAAKTSGKPQSALPEGDDTPTDDTGDDTTEAAPRTASKSAKPLLISDTGLELIEWVSLDCSADSGPWHADEERKIDKKSMVSRNGIKTKTFWDGTISSTTRPLRLKIRNIAGDESVFALPSAPNAAGNAAL